MYFRRVQLYQKFIESVELGKLPKTTLQMWD